MTNLTTLQKCIWLESQNLDAETYIDVWNIGDGIMFDGETCPQNVDYIDKLYEQYNAPAEPV